MKHFKIKTDVTVNNFVNPDTGEILDQKTEVKHHKIVVSDRETFAMIFIPIIGLIDSLDKISNKVLQWCALNADYNSNVIHMNKYNCSMIEKDFGIKYQTIKDAIHRLKKQNVLIPMSRGTYRINPRYYWKGQSSERLRTMKYILEVECPDCLQKTEIERELPNNEEFLQAAEPIQKYE